MDNKILIVLLLIIFLIGISLWYDCNYTKCYICKATKAP